MPTARLPIDAAHRAASSDAHAIGAVTGLTDALAGKAAIAATDDEGGIILEPVRQPVLAVEAVFPRDGQMYRVVWAQGQTAYAVDKALRIRKTIDGGLTWTLVSGYNSPSVELGHNAAFLKLASGAFVTIGNQTPLRLWRSADDCATWTNVYTMAANKTVLGPQGLCQDEATGYIYVVEYTTTATETTINVLQSVDDGATFSIFQTFDGPGSAGAQKMRHLHSAQYDSVSQRVWITAGDGTYPGAGIYRMNAAGTAFEPVLLDDVKYPVALMFFPDYIAWGSDSGASQHIYRMARSQVGEASPTVEQIYRINSTSWGTCRASSGGSEWLCLSSNEVPSGPARLDAAAHVYHVSDNGSRIVEVGCVPGSNDGFARFVPVGSAEAHDTTLWLAGTFDRGQSLIQLRAVMSRGSITLLPDRPVSQRVLAWQTFNIPPTTLAASEVINFAALRVPNYAKKLYVFDVGGYLHSGSGSVRVGLYRTDTASFFSFAGRSSGEGSFGLRYGNERHDGGEYIAAYDLTGSSLLQLRMYEYGGSSGVTASGYVTIGWGF